MRSLPCLQHGFEHEELLEPLYVHTKSWYNKSDDVMNLSMGTISSVFLRGTQARSHPCIGTKYVHFYGRICIHYTYDRAHMIQYTGYNYNL